MAERIIEGRIYPIGIQSFPELREGGYTYVDKTFFVAKLITEGKYIFLSRPRRFGKSLFLSTIHAYFDGRRELFKGLEIDSLDMDWTPRPVLHFDLNAEDYDQEEALFYILDRILSEYEQKYQITEIETTLSGRFSHLIKKINQTTGQKVAILVDEYDKPLLKLEEDSAIFIKRQSMLKGFFSNLKTLDEYISFAMITGVARFSKVSIFSDLNNLDDISMSETYQEICGWTEEELVNHFAFGIEKLATKRKETMEQTIKELRNFYDGYLFNEEGTRLYNPFSVLKALKDRDIKPYWYETGTPTFLAKKIKKNRLDVETINGQTQTYSNLLAVGTNNIIALMFQTGYLTIDSYDARRQKYTLRYPNREVEIGFCENLLPLYAPETQKPGGYFNIELFKDDLYDGDPERYMKRLQTLMKDLPWEDQQESTYRAITYLISLLSGTEAQPERHSYKGRSDLEVLTHDFVYVFEFKYNKSVREAIEQIHSRDYAGRYAMDNRTIYLIGANFTDKKDNRGLEYKIEMLK